MSEQVDERLRTLGEVGRGHGVGFSAEEVMAGGASSAARLRNGTAARRLGSAVRRPAVVLLVACVLAGVVVVGLAVTKPRSSTTHPPLHSAGPVAVDTSLTPPGWYPVIYGNIEISAPHAWIVEQPSQLVCEDSVGLVFVGLSARPPGSSCRLASNDVSLTHAPRTPPAGTTAVPTLVNGLPVERWQDGHETVLRTGGVTITVLGSYAARIIATLTYSPLALVLGDHTVATPSSWQRRREGAVSVAVPKDWHVVDTDGSCSSCEARYPRGELQLADDDTSSAGSYGGPMDSVGDLAATPTASVAFGKYLQHFGGTGNCRIRATLKLCLVASTTPGHLDVRVVPTHGAWPNGAGQAIDVTVGLYGNGEVAQTIFDSIQAATFSPPAGLGRCRSSALTATPGRYGEAGGQFSQTVWVVNTSTQPCSIKGWPGVTVKLEDGNVLSSTVRVRQTAPMTAADERIVLFPGETASFDLYGADWNAQQNAACPRGDVTGATSPSGGPLHVISFSILACAAPYVSPVVPGFSDRQAWSAIVTGDNQG